jgi:hypothetical protein
VPAEANSQTRQLRGVLRGLSATPATPITVLSDGADGLRSLGEAASPGPTHYVLDWFHLAMRLQHVAQAAMSWPDTTKTDRQAGARLAEDPPQPAADPWTGTGAGDSGTGRVEPSFVHSFGLGQADGILLRGYFPRLINLAAKVLRAHD